jgi:hypothetical protein
MHVLGLHGSSQCASEGIQVVRVPSSKDEFGVAAVKHHSPGCERNGEDHSVLSSVASLLCCVSFRSLRIASLSDQFRHVFDRAEMESPHAQELLPGIPILLHGDIIDIEEVARSLFDNPHRVLIASELHPVYFAFWRVFSVMSHTLNARPYSATRREPKEGTPCKGTTATCDRRLPNWPKRKRRGWRCMF